MKHVILNIFQTFQSASAQHKSIQHKNITNLKKSLILCYVYINTLFDIFLSLTL